MRLAILLLALIAVPVAAAEQQQFDLVCTAKNASERYRIDLSRGEWCSEKCEFVQKLASATSGLIVLAEHAPQYGGDRSSHNRVNRITGEWEWFSSDPRYASIMDHKGTCRAAPFSGIPTSKF